MMMREEMKGQRKEDKTARDSVEYARGREKKEDREGKKGEGSDG